MCTSTSLAAGKASDVEGSEDVEEEMEEASDEEIPEILEEENPFTAEHNQWLKWKDKYRKQKKEHNKWLVDKAELLKELPRACLPQHYKHGKDNWTLHSAGRACIEVQLKCQKFYIKMLESGA